jgi:F-type H+-transporting ATPase subunit epsilon
MADNFLVNPRQFKFELVGPEKIEVSSLEERVTLPGEEGDFMVLAGHTLLLAGLRPGIISVTHANNNVVRYFIDGGFADVGNAHCTVLSPTIIPVVRIVVDQVVREIEHLERDIAEAANDDTRRQRLEKDMEVLQLKLEAAQKYNA